MNKTEHYNLNQWQRHDRVLMDDFNADNAKIDAALKAEADARAAADTAINTALAKKADQSALTALQTTVNTVSTRAGARKIKTGTPLAKDAPSYTITFDGIDCSQWKTLYLLITVVSNGQVNIGGNTAQSRGTLTPGKNLLIYYPFFDASANASAFYPRGGTYGSYIFGPNSFATFQAVLFLSNGNILAGTTYEVWGEK